MWPELASFLKVLLTCADFLASRKQRGNLRVSPQNWVRAVSLSDQCPFILSSSEGNLALCLSGSILHRDSVKATNL